ncbi:MAG: DUF4097 family beta strand repeat-containing protein [Bryobacteraceae bacterium]
MSLRFSTLILALGLTGCDWDDFGNSQAYKEDFHHSYPLKPGGKVTVESFNGSVEVSGWNQDTVDVSGTKYANSENLMNAIKIDIVADSGSVRIRTIRPSERRGSLGARYVIKVPHKTHLDGINTSNASIRAEEIDAPARLRTSNGSIRLGKMQGAVEATTSNASIEIEDLEGPAVLKTSNGQVRAESVRGSFDATTSNASIRARLARSEPRRPIRLETSNGSIDLTLDVLNENDVRASTSNAGITVRMPSALNAKVRAHTSNSSISSEFDVRREGAQTKHRLDGTIGAGGPLLELGTSNGSIKLIKL